MLLAGVVLGAFFFTHFLPFGYPANRDALNVLKADYERKSTDLARARATVADLPRFEAEYEQLHERWIMAAELLPEDKQLAALLRKITLAGQQTGVEFVSFRPAGLKNEPHYSELPLNISVTGGYHQVGAFLAELANMRRIITVSNVRLASNGGAGRSKTGPTEGTTSADFTASAYSLNTASAAPAPPADDKKGGSSNASKS
jgi:type IV pilus assembly protein PilO